MRRDINVMAEIAFIYPLIALWVGACLLLLFARPLRRSTRPGVSAAPAGVALLASLAFLVRQGNDGLNVIAFGGSIAGDPLTASICTILLLCGIMAVALAPTYLAARGYDNPEYYVLLLTSLSGAMLMSMARDLVVVFLGIELLSFGLYIMTGFVREDARGGEASLKYFLLGAFASALMLYGIVLVYGSSGSTNIEALRSAVIKESVQSAMFAGGLALVVIGLAFKAAVAPFHQWSPDAYEGAPLPVTAFMSVVAKIAAFAVLIRLADTLAPLYATWLPAVRLLAVLSMVAGNVIAVAQQNIKRMLAYSGVAHAGYLMVAVAALGASHAKGAALDTQTLAMSGAVFYLLAYAIMTMGAFAVLTYISGSGAECQTLADLKGLARRRPATAYGMAALMLSLGGVPPTIGFMGKLQIFWAAVAGREMALAVTLALVSVVAAYYYLRVVLTMCFEEAGAEPVRAGAPRAAGWVAAISATAVLVLGVMPGLLMGLIGMVR